MKNIIERSTSIERPDARELLISRIKELRKGGFYVRAKQLEVEMLKDFSSEEKALYNRGEFR